MKNKDVNFIMFIVVFPVCIYILTAGHLVPKFLKLQPGNQLPKQQGIKYLMMTEHMFKSYNWILLQRFQVRLKYRLVKQKQKVITGLYYIYFIYRKY